MPMESKIISWPRFASRIARGKQLALHSLPLSGHTSPTPAQQHREIWQRRRAALVVELYAKHAAQQTWFTLSVRYEGLVQEVYYEGFCLDVYDNGFTVRYVPIPEPDQAT